MPVFSSNLADYASLGLDKRLREERKKLKLTLRQVADKAGVSEAKLSQIENGKLVPDMAELREIALSMNVPLSVLLPRSEHRHYLVHRSADAPHEKTILMHEMDGSSPGPKQHHNTFMPIAEPFVGRHLEPWLGSIHPLPDDRLQFVQHDYEEFVFLLDGEIEFLLLTGSEPPVRENLGAGDSLYFRSCLPHCLRATSSHPARGLHVMVSLGGIDADDGRYEASGRGYYRRVVDDSIVREVADKIALLRQSNGLTLAQLADAVGVSARSLAHVERGDKPADIDLLLRIARRFWRPIEYFYSTSLEGEPYYFIQRAKDIEAVPALARSAPYESKAGHAVHTYRSLAPGFSGRSMHPYYVRAPASADEPSQTHAHFGEEFVYVLDGEVQYVAESQGNRVVEVLHPGDSIYFDSSIPHLFNGLSRNPLGNTKAEVIDVFFSPLGESYLFNQH